MPSEFKFPKKLMTQLVEDHGKDINRWPQELRDLIDSSITARTISPPESGRVEQFLNTDYHYHWAKDICGQTPNHERVESMKWAGWEFATTDDVLMCSEASVVGRSQKRNGRDGKGFSDEIRSGDRRLMKLPMTLWRQKRKAENLAAYQLAYPQPFSTEGKPMTTESLIPGLRSEMLDPAQIDEARSRANPSNSVTVGSKH